MQKPEHHIVAAQTLLRVWVALIVFTAITITVARLQLGRFSILAALGIASIKAGLVLWYFMHLKYEKRLFKLMLFVPIITLTVIIGLTFFDIGYR